MVDQKIALKVYFSVTANECIEMTRERFIQALEEYLIRTKK